MPICTYVAKPSYRITILLVSVPERGAISMNDRAELYVCSAVQPSCGRYSA